MPEVMVVGLERSVKRVVLQKARFVSKEQVEDFYKVSVETYLARTHPCRKVCMGGVVRYAVPCEDYPLLKDCVVKVYTRALRPLAKPRRDTNHILDAD